MPEEEVDVLYGTSKQTIGGSDDGGTINACVPWGDRGEADGGQTFVVDARRRP